MAKEDEKIKEEIDKRLEILEERIKEEKLKKIFSGKYDRNDAYLSIHAGSGGKDAEDWARILLRMYLKFLKKKGFSVKEMELQKGEGGIKSVTLEVKGKYAFGWLKNENGVHRLVRISPFSRKGLRHTSFALVEVIPKLKKPQIQIKKEDLKIETFRASGPGGQYVNKRESAVRITHIPTGITVSCQSERLQGENRKKALALLEAKLFALAEKEREKKEKEVRGEIKIASWGNQIRSYIFHPYHLVKDHRTGIETRKLEEILEGDLDKFILQEK